MTPFGARSLAVGISAGVHTAVLLAPIGHPATALSSGVTIDLEVALPVETTEQAPAPVANKAAATAWPTHTHPAIRN